MKDQLLLLASATMLLTLCCRHGCCFSVSPCLAFALSVGLECKWPVAESPQCGCNWCDTGAELKIHERGFVSWMSLCENTFTNLMYENSISILITAYLCTQKCTLAQFHAKVSTKISMHHLISINVASTARPSSSPTPHFSTSGCFLVLVSKKKKRRRSEGKLKCKSIHLSTHINLHVYSPTESLPVEVFWTHSTVSRPWDRCMKIREDVKENQSYSANVIPTCDIDWEDGQYRNVFMNKICITLLVVYLSAIKL